MARVKMIEHEGEIVNKKDRCSGKCNKRKRKKK